MMKHLKKALSLVLCCVLCTALCACGKTQTGDEERAAVTVTIINKTDAVTALDASFAVDEETVSSLGVENAASGETIGEGPFTFSLLQDQIERSGDLKHLVFHLSICENGEQEGDNIAVAMRSKMGDSYSFELTQVGSYYSLREVK